MVFGRGKHGVVLSTSSKHVLGVQIEKLSFQVNLMDSIGDLILWCEESEQFTKAPPFGYQGLPEGQGFSSINPYGLMNVLSIRI